LLRRGQREQRYTNDNEQSRAAQKPCLFTRMLESQYVANTLSHSFSGVKIANHAMGRPGIRVILFRDGRYCRGLGGNGFFFEMADWDELGGRAEGVTLPGPGHRPPTLLCG
jgi:hypothetical protein